MNNEAIVMLMMRRASSHEQCMEPIKCIYTGIRRSKGCPRNSIAIAQERDRGWGMPWVCPNKIIIIILYNTIENKSISKPVKKFVCLLACLELLCLFGCVGSLASLLYGNDHRVSLFSQFTDIQIIWMALRLSIRLSIHFMHVDDICCCSHRNFSIFLFRNRKPEQKLTRLAPAWKFSSYKNIDNCWSECS